MTSDAEIEGIVQRIMQRYVEARQNAQKKSIQDLILKVEEKVTDIFNTAVTDFYNDYTPKRYKREGSTVNFNGGMYELLRIDKSLSKLTLKIDFDETQLSYRNGYNGENGLYDLVFRDGHGYGSSPGKGRAWHGGSWRELDDGREGMMYPNTAPAVSASNVPLRVIQNEVDKLQRSGFFITYYYKALQRNFAKLLRNRKG